MKRKWIAVTVFALFCFSQTLQAISLVDTFVEWKKKASDINAYMFMNWSCVGAESPVFGEGLFWGLTDGNESNTMPAFGVLTPFSSCHKRWKLCHEIMSVRLVVCDMKLGSRDFSVHNPVAQTRGLGGLAHA